MSSGKQKHVLVAVLDWGLGHATRSIPVIRCLLKNQCRVSIAGNGLSSILLRKEFPALHYYELPSYRISYPAHGFFFLNLMVQSPRIFRAIRAEHRVVEKLVDENKFDAIISDNRYGCYSQKIPSVFITHQLSIQVPVSLKWGECMVDWINHYLIDRFAGCWVPDFPDSRISGRLSAGKFRNKKFVGILSRFTPVNLAIENGLVVGLVSGPEPQREIFESRLVAQFKRLNQRCLVVRGLPKSERTESTNGNITLLNHASAEELQDIVSKAEIIISRSGYSTLMDLQVVGKKKIIFVPTPGQTEQEYLATEMERKKIAFTQPQDKLDLVAAIEAVKNYRGFEPIAPGTNLLEEAIEELLYKS